MSNEAFLTILRQLTLTLCLLPLCLRAQHTRFSNLSTGDFPTEIAYPALKSVPLHSPLWRKEIFKAFHKLPYDIGERSRYVITYLGIKGATMEALVRAPVLIQGRWAQRITGEILSARWYRYLYTIHDAIESIYLPGRKHNPLRFYINQNEGDSFTQTKVIRFDHKKLKVIQNRKRKGEVIPQEEFDMVADTKDAFGALFYVRTLAYLKELGKKPQFPIFTSEKNWTATAKFIKDEKIEVEDREYRTERWEVKTQLGGILEQKGRVEVWMTKDERFLPVYIEAEIKFGHVKISLTHWEQGRANPRYKKIYPKIKPED